MKPAGLLGCGSILHAACREDKETAEPSKFLALEVPLEGGGWRDRHGRAMLPLNQLRIAPHALRSQEEGSQGTHSLPQTAAPKVPNQGHGGISQREAGSGRGAIHPPHSTLTLGQRARLEAGMEDKT